MSCGCSLCRQTLEGRICENRCVCPSCCITSRSGTNRCCITSRPGVASHCAQATTSGEEHDHNMSHDMLCPDALALCAAGQAETMCVQTLLWLHCTCADVRVNAVKYHLSCSSSTAPCVGSRIATCNQHDVHAVSKAVCLQTVLRFTVLSGVNRGKAGMYLRTGVARTNRAGSLDHKIRAQEA